MDTDYKRIIIVDDNEIYRAGLKALINSQKDFKVVAEAESGDTALSAIRRFPADLVLLDLSLPKINGFEVLKKIREITKELKVLILSIYESQDMVQKAIECGADSYCIKDISRKKLMQAISDTLEDRDFTCHKGD
jgi:DNA-binding NarL/FixJ family response regulator